MTDCSRRIAFMGRVGPETDAYAGVLASAGVLNLFIAETGVAARRRKWSRMVRETGRVQATVNALALLLFGRLSERRLRQALHQDIDRAPHPNLSVADANDPVVIDRLRESQIDVLIIHGTALLGEPVLNTCHRVVNIHGRMVPAYRNVYGDFWALASNRPQDVGFSLLIVTPGIDSGPVLVSRSVKLRSRARLSTARALICRGASKELEEMIEDGRFNGPLEGTQQRGPSGFTRTPSAWDLLRSRVRP